MIAGSKIAALTSEIAGGLGRSGPGPLAPSAGLHRASDRLQDATPDDVIVVHLSDFHFGPNHAFRVDWGDGNVANDNSSPIEEVVLDDLRELEIVERVDALVVSGDFAQQGKPAEFAAARRSIRRLLDGLGLATDRLLLVPGNHDIEWLTDADGEPAGSSRVAFNEFLAVLDKGSATQSLDTVETYGDCIAVESRSGHHAVEIIGVDSNLIEGQRASGVGFVGSASLEAASTRLEQLGQRDCDSVRRWLVLHHHLFPVTSSLLGDAADRNVSVLANAPRVIVAARKWGVDVVLHGHAHQPSVTVASSWPSTSGGVFPNVVIVGAGSVGVDRTNIGPVARNQYFVLQSRGDELLVHSRLTSVLGEVFADDACLRYGGRQPE